jgi:hypothetical protein
MGPQRASRARPCIGIEFVQRDDPFADDEPLTFDRVTDKGVAINRLRGASRIADPVAD